MKKVYTSFMLILGLLIGSMTFAQEELAVAPGLGTLNDAIDANGGDKIYMLEDNGVYILTAPIENVDYHLIIKGGPTDIYNPDPATWPPTVQTGTTVEGDPLPSMFAAKGSLTLENLYVMNVDANGQTPDNMISQSDSGASVIINNCVLDPLGKNGFLAMNGGFNDLIMTNNICIRHGHMSGANDGATINITSDAAPGGADTVRIQNNTWVSTGMTWMAGSFAKQVNNVVIIDHNTFVQNKSQIDWNKWENEYYNSNNLYFDMMTSPYSHAWQPMPGGDISMPKPGWIYADTIEDEVLPSTRIQYVQWNNVFHTQGFYDLVAEIHALDDSITRAGLQPFLFTPEFASGTDLGTKWGNTDGTVNREAMLFNHSGNTNTDFPMWKYGNCTFDVDPGWTDSRIYDMSDSLVKWQRPATFIHALKYPATEFPDPTEWAEWHWEPDGDVAVNDAWPVYDGTYSSAELMTASVANLPLGDLNWFPEKKAMWLKHQDAIFEHMKAGNETKYMNVGFEELSARAGTFSRVYPNPVTGVAMIEFSLSAPVNVEIALYNTIGQKVSQVLDEYRSAGKHTVSFDGGALNDGLYFYTIKAGSLSETQKLMISK